MTAKQQYALVKILAAIPDDRRESFREVAEYAISLGYMPAIKGARGTYADFTNSKFRREIMKIDTDPNFPTRLAVRFHAMPAYSGIFQAALDERVRILREMGHEPRCWGCGKCDGTHGYTLTNPGGKQGFLCGSGVLTLPGFGAQNVSEIKEALKLQDEFFVEHIAK